MPSRLDSMVSKGVGKVKAVKARQAGLVGVFSTLTEQHGEVSVLLKSLQRDSEKKLELWPDIRRALLSHERGELREVTPVLRQYAETRELADYHVREAAELENLIDHIDTAPDDTWRPLLDRLVDTVMHHADFEEKYVFPLAQEVIGADTARELDAKFLAAKLHVERMV
ncbi:MAG: hemerythrin domain-containing protein [Kofleriaceae bacterium]